jgi:hypothetical protein
MHVHNILVRLSAHNSTHAAVLWLMDETARSDSAAARSGTESCVATPYHSG